MNVKTRLDELLNLTAYKAGLDKRIEHLREGLASEARRRYEEEEAAPTWKARGSGTAAFVVPEPKPTVTDDKAWLAYVAATSPGDVETVERVRPHVLEAVLDRCEQVGDRFADPETGEVIPGVETRQGAPYLRVTLDADRKAQAIAEALDDLDGAA